MYYFANHKYPAESKQPPKTSNHLNAVSCCFCLPGKQKRSSATHVSPAIPGINGAPPLRSYSRSGAFAAILMPSRPGFALQQEILRVQLMASPLPFEPRPSVTRVLASDIPDTKGFTHRLIYPTSWLGTGVINYIRIIGNPSGLVSEQLS